MNLEEFKAKLTNLASGQAAHVPYAIFEDLFPPGVEDDGAKGRAYELAKAHGCFIEHRSQAGEVLFVKGPVPTP